MEIEFETKTKPIASETGDWDGKKSNLCLCVDEKGEYHLACYYEYENNEGEWYDKDDYGLNHQVTKWYELPL